DAARLVGEAEQGLHLGGEAQLVADARPEQRLLPGAMAGEDQPAARVVPKRQAEHPFEARDAVGSLARVQRHDGLDVALRPERIAAALAVPAQLGRVVDLAVTDHPDVAVGALKRLIAGGQVHDREAAGAEARAGVPDDALAVGPAVGEGGGHRCEPVGVAEGRAGERDRAEDAAHVASPPGPLGTSPPDPLSTSWRGGTRGGT